MPLFARFQALAANVIKPEKRQIEMALVSSKINIFDAFFFVFEYYRCPPSIELIKIGGQI